MISDKEVLVLIPAFNEEDRIRDVIEGVRKHLPDSDILVVNDGSQDRTGEESRNSGAVVLNHPFNLGVGTALQTGYKYAVRYGYQYVIQLDADGQHPSSYLPSFMQKLKESQADLVIGSRFRPGGQTEGSFARRMGNKLFAGLISLLIREKISDPTSGYRALKRTVLQFCVQDTYGFDYPDADFLLTLHRSGFTFDEIPIHIEPRKGGESQHKGFKPVFYVIKMMLSIFVILLRKKTTLKG